MDNIVYQVSVEGTKGIILLEGDFDNEFAGEALREAANRLLDQGCKTIVLDLSKVEIINEFGIGKMLQLQKRLDAEEKKLRVKPLRGFVREVIDLLMLQSLFPVDTGEDDELTGDGIEG